MSDLAEEDPPKAQGWSALAQNLLGSWQSILPQGLPLGSDVWNARHRFIVVLLFVHVPIIVLFGAWRNTEPLHLLGEAAIPGLLALGAWQFQSQRKVASTLASFGLLSCSAILVHLSGGYIEMHFHFFVMLPIISLYHDWTPFLLAIGYVAVHHGVMGSLDPTSVYNHPDAIAHPWRWAAIHAFFILGICAASVYNWRLTERAMDRELASEREATRFSTALLRTASHELNTPLTPLSLQLAMLQSEQLGPLSDRQRRSLQVIDRNFKRLAGLVRDVVEATRLRDGRLSIMRQPVDLGEVVAETAEIFREVALHRRVDLRVEVPERVLVEGDASRLVQVFTNLLTNAFKFTPDGGSVRINLSVRGHEVVVLVEDTGRGLEPEQIGQLFQAFSQVQRADVSLGMGLGLFISRGIVDQHGGRIWASSPGVGKGATFAVALPLRSSTLEAPPAEAVLAPAAQS